MNAYSLFYSVNSVHTENYKYPNSWTLHALRASFGTQHEYFIGELSL